MPPLGRGNNDSKKWLKIRAMERQFRHWEINKKTPVQSTNGCQSTRFPGKVLVLFI